MNYFQHYKSIKKKKNSLYFFSFYSFSRGKSYSKWSTCMVGSGHAAALTVQGQENPFYNRKKVLELPLRNYKTIKGSNNKTISRKESFFQYLFVYYITNASNVYKKYIHI